MPQTNPVPKLILLADDDADDRMLFEEALIEIDTRILLNTATDGEELMHMLEKKVRLDPIVIFLDLNMPKKNGFECLKEIKQKDKFKDIPVIVYSTSCQEETINQMYVHGASYYICKPNSFAKLKDSIQHIFLSGFNKLVQQPSLKDFVIAL
jgi:CheY-like chemotaxis protein